MDVRDLQAQKQYSPKLVTLYTTPSQVTPSEIETSVAEPLYCASSAVFASVSNLYLNPSVLYSMMPALTAMLIMAKRETSINLKVNKFFIHKSFLPIAPFWRLVNRNVVVCIHRQRTWSPSCHSFHVQKAFALPCF